MRSRLKNSTMQLSTQIFAFIVLHQFLPGVTEKSTTLSVRTVQQNLQSRMRNSRKRSLLVVKMCFVHSVFKVCCFFFMCSRVSVFFCVLVYNEIYETLMRFMLFLMRFIAIHNTNTSPARVYYAGSWDGKLNSHLEWP